MTKKEILKQWLKEPRAKYESKSSFVLGYGDGWEWVKDTLRPAATKNATFLSALKFAFAETDKFLKENSGKRKLTPEECTVYAVGFKDGVADSIKAIRKRLENSN